MVEDKWLLVVAVPVAIYLSLSIWRRIRDLNARIDQLKRDEASGPVNPYQAMFDITAAQRPAPKKKPESIDHKE